MPAESVAQLAGSLGFPIVAFFLIYNFATKTVENLRHAVRKNTETVAGMEKALVENTAVLRELKVILDGVRFRG